MPRAAHFPRSCRSLPNAIALSSALLVALFAGVPAALASPSPPSGPTVSGSVSGALKRGGVVTFRVAVNEPGGWRNLDEVQITMILHSLTLAQVSYLPSAGRIALRGGSLVRVGTDGTLEGSFFRFSGLDVTLVEGGNRLGMTIRARVSQDIPAGTQFQLAATDASGASASVTRVANVSRGGGGLSWGTLAAAVLAALFIGGLAGGLFASRRRPEARASVYAMISRRLQDERTAP